MVADPVADSTSPQLDARVVDTVRRWISTVVIHHQLCPFARLPFEKDRIRFVHTNVTSPKSLLLTLKKETQLLVDDDSIETSFIIHPRALEDFFVYNRFLKDGEKLLRGMGWEGLIQIASFHPQYLFADADYDAPENFSNRSPYPMLHLLREDSVDRAVSSYPDVNSIPAKNIETLNKLGAKKLQSLWDDCLKVPEIDG